MSNLSPKKILCFGDSNTWGYIPMLGIEDQRYSQNQRWTGFLQASLPECVILEEGLNSRTTNLDDPDFEGKNGLKYLPNILHHHHSVDLLIMMLGTNDLKKKFNRKPEEIAKGLESLILVARDGGVKDILVLSPPIPKLAVIYDSYQYPELEIKARQLAPLFENVAKRCGSYFINLAEVVISSDIDGAHLDPHEHQKLASIVLKFVHNWNLGKVR